MSVPRWTCPRCGSNNMPQSATCFRCGTMQPFSPPPPAAPEPRPNRTLLNVTIACALFSALWIGYTQLLPMAQIKVEEAATATREAAARSEAVAAGRFAKITWTTDSVDGSVTGQLQNTGSVTLKGVSIECGSRTNSIASWYASSYRPRIPGEQDPIEPNPDLKPGESRGFVFTNCLYGSPPYRIKVIDAERHVIPTAQQKQGN